MPYLTARRPARTRRTWNCARIEDNRAIPPARPGRVRLGKRRKRMKRILKSMMFAVLLAGALVTVLAPHAAAQNGSIAGTILDVNGKPWFGLNVEAVSDQGSKLDAKTDAEGKFNIRNLRPG